MIDTDVKDSAVDCYQQLGAASLTPSSIFAPLLWICRGPWFAPRPIGWLVYDLLRFPAGKQ